MVDSVNRGGYSRAVRRLRAVHGPLTDHKKDGYSKQIQTKTYKDDSLYYVSISDLDEKTVESEVL